MKRRALATSSSAAAALPGDDANMISGFVRMSDISPIKAMSDISPNKSMVISSPDTENKQEKKKAVKPIKNKGIKITGKQP